jgi:phospholipase/carboxylesterase
MSRINETITIQNWVIRIQRPEGSGPFPVVLMLHGWTGDENSMWIFASRLPKKALIIAPRGLFTARETGYSWHPEIPTSWPWINDFLPAAESLYNQISVRNITDGNFDELNILGFSQGAALAYAMTIIHPERVTSLAGLSGFLPAGASSWLGPNRLNGLPVFIAHGTNDDLVPVERARESVGFLQDAGANVIYCEDNVSHKLSAKCFHGLEAFYQKVNC